MNVSKRRPKRMKRSYLKRWSSGVVTGKSGRLTPWIMGSMHGNPRGDTDAIIRHVSGRLAAYREFVDPTSDPKLEIERTLEAWQSDFFQGFNQFCFIVIYGKHYTSLKRYFCGERTYFIQETEEEIRRSVIYPTKELAMLSFNLGRIKWIASKRKTDPPDCP